MPENIIMTALLLVCAVRSASYAIFTIKNKNITGGISILLLPLAASVGALILMLS